MNPIHNMLYAAIAALVVCGPGVAGPVTTRPTTAPATQPAAEKPPMFDEAKLPKGFPPPGPIGDVVIKQYPAARSAVVESKALPNGNANGMFMPLFNHIKRNHIEMSAPVDMTWAEPSADGTPAKPVAMAFIYGDPQIGKTGADGIVQVVDVPAMTVVSIAVRGDYNVDHFNSGLVDLKRWLQDHRAEYVASGPPRYLGYNSPFVPPFMRIGEVQIPVTKSAPADAK